MTSDCQASVSLASFARPDGDAPAFDRGWRYWSDLSETGDPGHPMHQLWGMPTFDFDTGIVTASIDSRFPRTAGIYYYKDLPPAAASMLVHPGAILAEVVAVDDATLRPFGEYAACSSMRVQIERAWVQPSLSDRWRFRSVEVRPFDLRTLPLTPDQRSSIRLHLTERLLGDGLVETQRQAIVRHLATANLWREDRSTFPDSSYGDDAK